MGEDSQVRIIYKGVAKIFKEWGRGHTVSHPGYLPDCHGDIHALFY